MIPNVPQEHFGFGDLFMTAKINKGVCHTMALPFTLKSILGEKQNYENSNISPCKNRIFKKSY
jgi:hypothetical protein